MVLPTVLSTDDHLLFLDILSSLGFLDTTLSWYSFSLVCLPFSFSLAGSSSSLTLNIGVFQAPSLFLSPSLSTLTPLVILPSLRAVGIMCMPMCLKHVQNCTQGTDFFPKIQIHLSPAYSALPFACVLTWLQLNFWSSPQILFYLQPSFSLWLAMPSVHLLRPELTDIFD